MCLFSCKCSDIYTCIHAPTYTLYTGQMGGKLCSSGEGGTDDKDLPVGTRLCGSAHDCGCVVDGSNAMVAL